MRVCLAICLFCATVLLLPRHARASEPTLDHVLERSDQARFHALKSLVLQQQVDTVNDLATTELHRLARTYGWESELPVASESLPDDIREQTKLSKQLALIDAGRRAAALKLFQSDLKSAAPRLSETIISWTATLASRLQVAEEEELAAMVFEIAADRFFLNAPVKRSLLRRKARLETLGKSVGDLSVVDIKGQTHSLGRKGAITVIDFWATNCAPCIESFPHLRRLYDRYHQNGLRILGISLDSSAEKVAAFEEASVPLPWPAIWSEGEADRTRRFFAVESIPAVFVLDEDGLVVAVDPTPADLRRLIHRHANRTLRENAGPQQE